MASDSQETRVITVAPYPMAQPQEAGGYGIYTLSKLSREISLCLAARIRRSDESLREVSLSDISGPGVGEPSLNKVGQKPDRRLLIRASEQGLKGDLSLPRQQGYRGQTEV